MRCGYACLYGLAGLYAALGMPLAALPAPLDAPAARPNVVVVLVADLRFDEAGCAGHPVVATPHLDRVAREGARFTRCFAATPLCSPNRASLLTGQCAHTHGIIDNTERGPQSHQLPTFARTLQAAGYETAFLGKWHMGNDDAPRPGFDYWVSMQGHGSTTDPMLNENGRRGRAAGYITDILTERAVQFVQRARNAPFLLYLAHKALNPDLVQYADGSISDPTALQFNPAPRHRGLYEGVAVPRRPNTADTLQGKPALSRKRGDLPPLGQGSGPSDETIRQRWRMLAAVDEGLGRLLATLEEGGLLDNTLLVVTSDHGHFAGEHGLGVERRLAYEESARVPLLMRYPPLIAAGTVIDELASSVDLAPTVLDLAAAAAAHGAVLHGRSLVPLLGGEATAWRRAVLIEHASDGVFPRVADMGYHAVRTARHKYIRYSELTDMDELYDLEADPYEMHNLLDAGAAAELLEEMEQHLLRLMAESGGRLPRGGPGRR